MTATTESSAVLLLRPALPTFEAPAGMPGAIEVQGTAYGFAYNCTKPLKKAPAAILGYVLLGGAGRVYNVPADMTSCECGDYVHRKAATNEPCKHLRSIRELIASGKIAGNVSTPTAPEEF